MRATRTRTGSTRRLAYTATTGVQIGVPDVWQHRIDRQDDGPLTCLAMGGSETPTDAGPTAGRRFARHVRGTQSNALVRHRRRVRRGGINLAAMERGLDAHSVAQPFG